MTRKQKIPKYLVIAKAIAKEIESGKIKAGEKVPSENDIIEKFGVSNATSRKTLLELELKGLVKRVRGKGTIVLEQSNFYLSRALGSFSAIKGSFSGNLKRDGIKPEAKIIERKLYKGKINIQVGENFYEIVGKIFKLRTLRYGNSKLLKDETFYFDMSLCEGIENVGNINTLVILLSKNFGIDISNVDRNIFATLIEKDQYFKNTKVMAGVRIDGAFLLPSKRTVVIEKSLYRGDCYKFTVDSKS